MRERRYPPAVLPSCFKPKVYVCPNPECLFIGSVSQQDESGGFCWSCVTPLGPEDMRVFGPLEAGEAGHGD